MTQLRSIPNQQSKITALCEPWSIVPVIPAAVQKDKSAFANWSMDPETEYYFYTASEGVNGALRCNKQNPIRKLHGLIADYDVTIGEAMESEGLANAMPELRPSWVSTTFSNHRRLLWLFEAPLAIDPAIVKPFLTYAHGVLRLEKLLPALDKGAWFDLYKTYALGRDWRNLGGVLTTATLHYWLVEAAKKTKWHADVAIPLDRIAEEVERLYPGRWSGEFKEGARGCAFFDLNSTNATSSIVTENGMICFSQEKLFYSWTELFPALARKYQADKIGSAVADTHFDGKSYFQKIEGKWMTIAKEDFVKWLCAEKGLDKGTERSETASETTRAEVFVQRQRRVAGVVPRIFDPNDIVEINGQKFLNISCVKPVEPAEEKQEWGTNFPWLADFLDTCFDPVKQRDFFLAWWKRFYCSAVAGDVLKGHAMFIAGGVNLGKTLLGTRIVGASVGGYADASDFCSSNTEFNKQLLEVGLWTIDDGKTSSDPASHRRFSETIKRLVANPGFNYRAMFRDSQATEWSGRIIVTLNDDTHSLQMIPDLETSMEEKVMLLKFASTARRFPPKYELENRIASELPFLLRWLVDWEIPQVLVGDNRLGVVKYIHEDLRVRALHSGGVGDLLELVDLWIKKARPQDDAAGKGYWEGTASEWMSSVGAGDETLRLLVQKFTPKTLGKRFSEASRIRESRIEVADKSNSRGNRYRIVFAPEDKSVGRKTTKFVPEIEGTDK